MAPSSSAREVLCSDCVQPCRLIAVVRTLGERANGARTMQADPRPRGPLARLALACALASLALAVVELGYRFHTRRPVFALADWRAERVEYLKFGNVAK